MRFTKIIYCHTSNIVIETEQWCVLLTVSKWYKQTVHHTHIYKLEMIKNVLQCTYSWCENCALCFVGLWVDMFRCQCNTFCVMSMSFTYSIFIVSNWLSYTLLLCSIALTSLLCYWYIISNFCQIWGTNSLQKSFFKKMRWNSHTVHSSTGTSFQSHTTKSWKSGSMQHNVCFRNCEYMVMRGAVIYIQFHLTAFDWNFCTFSQNLFGYL